MPNPNQSFVDNAVPFGSRKETIGTVVAGSPPTISGGVLFIVENITLNYPTKEIRRPDEIGGPNGWVTVRDQPTGSCVIQIPMGSGTYDTSTGGWTGVPYPALGQGFVDSFLGTNETWIITSLGLPEEMLGYYKVNANLMQAIFAGASGL